MKEEWHGTHGGYTNHACRCKLCTAAARRYARDKRAKNVKEYVYKKEDPHGEHRMYQRGCRCPECQKSNAARSATAKRLRAQAPPRPDSCECCGRRGRLVIDHDHESDAFRGWVCNGCNVGIGGFGDSKQVIESAIRYLERSEK